jgi:hypothetical protein
MTKNITLQDVDLIALGIASEWPAHLREGSAAVGEGIVTSARAVVREFQAEVRRIHDSGEYSPAGMLRLLVETAARGIASLDRAAGDQIGKLRRDRDAATQRLAKLPANLDAAEVRFVQSQLLALPPAERIAAVQEAGAAGEAVVLHAAFTLPAFLRRKIADPPELLDAAHAQWIAARDPAAARELGLLDEAIVLAERAVDGARRAIIGTADLDAAPRNAISARLMPDPIRDVISRAG